MTTLVPPDPGADVVDDGLSESVCTKDHCFHAFDTLHCELTGSRPILPKFPDEKFPLFVTWNTLPTKPGRSSRLRGCVGCFEPLQLHDGIAEFAIVSAFRDHRFRKIERSELSSLECCVSLLTDFEDGNSYLDWTIGVHGIQITFQHPSLLSSAASSASPSPLSSSTFLPRFTSTKQTFSACYLPEVMPEQGWDKIEAIDSAIQKAGWSGRITEDLRRSIRLRRFQSKKARIDYDEYTKWREENETETLPN